MLGDFLSLIYPRTCLNCNDTLISVEKIICTSCKIDLPKTNDHLNVENELFQKFAYEPLVKMATALLYFNKGGLAQKIIHRLKYDGIQEVGEEMGLMLGSQLRELISPSIILPVPLHKKKLKKEDTIRVLVLE